MPTDNERMNNLEKMREEWVEVTRKNRFQEGIADLLAHQYSQKTHFIFELLQNAEDAGATQIEFRVEEKRLIFTHNGKRLFSDGNVESITSIGDSTKRDDHTQIGKHGIGFKAVFAYTHTPRIHSGDKHFDIVNVVVPQFLLPSDIPIDLDPNETRIILPFDSDEVLAAHRFRKLVPADKARLDISIALKQLSLRTVLFLRHIENIQWTLPDSSHGEIHRRLPSAINGNSSARSVTVTDGSNAETWMIFERTKNVLDDGKELQCIVEVAFLIKDDRVVCAPNTELVVFFPTEKKTELGFLIQGPFKTTKARDNIAQDSDANSQLIETAAQLAADSLILLRDMGLLHVESYNALPLRAANFLRESFFRIVYDRVRDTFKTKPLLPRHGGGFVAANEARLARGAQLPELFSHQQLGQLLDVENCSWLDAGITATNLPDLYVFLCGKKTWSDEWEQTPLVQGIQLEGRDLGKKINRSFFEEQDDSWLVKFYAYLENNLEPFKDTPFIRLQDGTHVSAGSKENPNAYLPPPNAADIDQTIFPLVRDTLADHEGVRNFLTEKVKLREPDKIEEIIRSRLLKYETGDLVFVPETYVQDLKAISEAHSNAKSEEVSRLLEALKSVPFVATVAAINPGTQVVWKKPDDASLFGRTPQLENWFAENDEDEAWFPHAIVELGISAEIRERLGWSRRSLQKDIGKHPTWDRSTHYKSSEGFNPMLGLLGLEWALSHPTFQRAEYLWSWLIENPGKIKGKERTSTNQMYPANNIRHFNGYSVLGLQSTKGAWLPKKGEDRFYRPDEVLLADLPDGFESDTPRSEILSRVLGFQQGVDPTLLAEAMGLASVEDAQEVAQLVRGRPIEELRTLLNRDQKAEQPMEAVSDPERRRKGVIEHRDNAPSKESVVRERSVQPGVKEETLEARAYLRTKYTNPHGELICQCCHKEMPFKVNDIHYFEAIQCVRGLDKHQYENRLALCPICAAMYRHARGTDDTEIRRRIISHDAPETTPSVEVLVSLAGAEYSMHFVGTHWFDLKTILQQ